MIRFVFAVLHVASVIGLRDCEKTRTDADCKTGDKCAKVEWASGSRWTDDLYICVKSDQCGEYYTSDSGTTWASTIKWDCAGVKPNP